VVITFGAINGGRKSNIIPGEVELLGTVRTVDPELRQQIPGWLEELIKGVTGPAGGSYQLNYQFGYPAVNNHPQGVRVLEQAGAKILGQKGIIKLKHPSMGAEDFAYYGEKVPACFATLGIGEPGKTPVPWHNPRFTVDEKALPLGVAVLAQAVLDFCQAAG
ncbi:MAG TPA: M20/M25/M40 family metallo-hydrolase, partial [Bacillota bacterium]|nr:M20/M25/M40 family metallo-hydrolase [Bacillota bacterium]